MIVTDILCDDSTGDLLITDGDFVIGDGTMQHQLDLLSSEEGTYKQDPITGIGSMNYIDDEGPSQFLRKIRLQFTRDGMEVTKCNVSSDGKLNVEADYTS